MDDVNRPVVLRLSTREEIEELRAACERVLDGEPTLMVFGAHPLSSTYRIYLTPQVLAAEPAR